MSMELARQWCAALNERDLGRLLGLYTDDAEFEDVIMGKKARGKPGLRALFSAFLDHEKTGVQRFEAVAYCGGPAGGAFEWVWTVRHAGDFWGRAAAGRVTSARGVSVLTLRGAKICLQRDYWDLGAVLRQLGRIG